MMEGTDKLEKRLLEMRKVNLRNGIQKGINLVQSAAKNNCPVRDGELRSKIFADVMEDGNAVRGTCWSGVAHGAYVELGTGPKGQVSHDGISPNIAPSYSQKPWWIHEGSGPNEIDRDTAELYHFPHIDTPDGRFYICAGQEARPYLYPALKDNEDRIVEIIANEVKEKIRKV